MSSAETVQLRCQGRNRTFLTPAVKQLKKKNPAAIVMLSFCTVHESNKNILTWTERAYVLWITQNSFLNNLKFCLIEALKLFCLVSTFFRCRGQRSSVSNCFYIWLRFKNQSSWEPDKITEPIISDRAEWLCIHFTVEIQKLNWDF